MNHRSAATVLVLVIFFDLSILLFRSAWLAPQTTVIGGCCDPEQGLWFLRRVPYAIAGFHNLLFTRLGNYPAGVNLMWNTSSVLPGLLLAPVSVTLGPIVTYNLYITLSVALSAWCAYLALRRYTRGHAGALVGAAVYGFSPYMLSQAMQHAHLVLAAVPPLLLLALDEIFVRQRRAAALMGSVVGALAAAQLLIAEELLAMAAIVAATVVVVLVILRPRQLRARLPYVGVALIWALAVFAVLAGWPLAVQFFGPQHLRGAVHQSDVYVSDLLNFVVPTFVQAFAPPEALHLASHFSGLEHEANAYLGFPLLLLLAYSAGRLWDQIAVRVASIVGVVTAVLSLGVHLHIAGQATKLVLPWTWLARLPLMGNILPSRLTVYMYLCVALLLAVFVDHILAVSRPRRLAIPALAVTALALVPLFPNQPFPAWTAHVPPFFAQWPMAAIPDGSVILIAPLPHDGGGADEMLWQAMAGDRFRSPNGYFITPGPDGRPFFGTEPITLYAAMDAIQEKGLQVDLDLPTRQAIAANLQAHHVDAVVVGPMPHYDLMVQFFTDLFGRGPEQVGGVALWR